MEKLEVIDKKLREVVDEKRYIHCKLVAKEAKELAKIYNVDLDKAYLTGLTHDIAKRFTDDENKKYVNKYKLDKSLLDDSYKKLLHADIGAIVVKEWFDFDDDMCDAIRYHTVARKDMTMLAKIVFISDKIGRVEIPDELKELKSIACHDIDKAMYIFLKRQREKFLSKDKDLKEETKELFDELKAKYE